MNLNSVGHQGSVVLHWPPSLPVMNDQFFDFCQLNKGLRMALQKLWDIEF